MGWRHTLDQRTKGNWNCWNVVKVTKPQVQRLQISSIFFPNVWGKAGHINTMNHHHQFKIFKRASVLLYCTEIRNNNNSFQFIYLTFISLYVRSRTKLGSLAPALSRVIEEKSMWMRAQKSRGVAESMYDKIASCIREADREVLGVSKGNFGERQGNWWWYGEVQGKV